MIWLPLTGLRLFDSKTVWYLKMEVYDKRPISSCLFDCQEWQGNCYGQLFVSRQPRHISKRTFCCPFPSQRSMWVTLFLWIVCHAKTLAYWRVIKERCARLVLYVRRIKQVWFFPADSPAYFRPSVRSRYFWEVRFQNTMLCMFVM